jgi:hypothetical protein
LSFFLLKSLSQRAYNPDDRINPKAQLDPKTKKSIEYMEEKRIAAKMHMS